MDETFLKYLAFASRDVRIELKNGNIIEGYLEDVGEPDEIDDNEVLLSLIVDNKDVDLLEHEVKDIKELT